MFFLSQHYLKVTNKISIIMLTSLQIMRTQMGARHGFMENKSFTPLIGCQIIFADKNVDH